MSKYITTKNSTTVVVETTVDDSDNVKITHTISPQKTSTYVTKSNYSGHSNRLPQSRANVINTYYSRSPEVRVAYTNS
jgi:hypothetical protein